MNTFESKMKKLQTQNFRGNLREFQFTFQYIDAI